MKSSIRPELLRVVGNGERNANRTVFRDDRTDSRFSATYRVPGNYILDDKQRLELQIEHLKGAVEVTRHISEYGDVEAKKKKEAWEESIKEREEDLEDLDDLNQALIIKERRTNDELQDARKELINGLKNRPTWKAFIGVKLMGCLDNKPIISAAKNKYPAAKLRDPNW